MFDVIVCGAGPAGAMAALRLARAGARVLVLDRAAFPRDKLCGDTINPGALRILERAGIAAPLHAGGIPIDGMIVTGERGVRVCARYAEGRRGLAILRRDLDLALLHAAAAAGARVEEGVLVRRPLVDEGPGLRVRGVCIAGSSGAEIRMPAPLVIAADGRRSRLAFGLGLARHPRRPRRWAIGAYFEGVAGVSRYGEMHVRGRRYIGVAPVPDGRTNLCLVVTPRRGERLADPAAALADAIARDPELRDRFAAARRLAPPVMLGPLAVDTVAAGVEGLLLAGDAAGFVDPMTGDGLRFALRGGELAADAALRRLGGGAVAAHVELARLRRREFASKWRFNRCMRALVGTPSAVRLAARATAVAPAWLAHAISYAGDVGLA